MSIPKKIILTGNIYIKYIDEQLINLAKLGDLMLLLNDDATSTIIGDYENTKLSGYFKVKIFDGKIWQFIDIGDFFENAEHKFAKKQKPLDTAYLCKDILKEFEGTTLYKSYRGHFTTKEYIPDPNARKHPKWHKPVTKN